MENWLVYLLTLAISISLTILLSFGIFLRPKRAPLPPGPRLFLPTITRSNFNMKHFIRRIADKHGPVISVKLIMKPVIFIADRKWAYQALIQHGTTFADRPKLNVAAKILSSDRRNINAAPYGPVWRTLRRNLMAEILHPSRVRMYAPARKWMLSILIDKLKVQMDKDGSVLAMESFQFAIFSMLALMCFGERLDEVKVREIEEAQNGLMQYIIKTHIFSFLPAVTKIIFRKRWNSILSYRKRQEDVFLPLIRACKDRQESKDAFFSYVDSLLDLKIPEDGSRKLTEDEIVSLCVEFFTAGADTVAASLQWIMANLVKQPEIQQRLWTEIEQTVGRDSDEVKEEDLQKMVYLKAVVLEALRLHPPGHFLLPHTVSEDLLLNGYRIPKGAVINVTVADIGRDESTWSDSHTFKPERFLEGGEGEGIDLTGTKEIKMMPFGAGRRVCPGMGAALMHLEYFVANLVNLFEWKELEEERVDLTEKEDFTVVMKKPFRAQIVPRK